MSSSTSFSSLAQSFLASPGWGPRGHALISSMAFGLGTLAGVSFVLAFVSESLRPFFVFCTVMAVFHQSEFLFAAVYHNYTCTSDAFLIPHSLAYSLAMGVAVVEYFIESFLVGPIFLPQVPFFWIGLAVVLGGQMLRWTAFVHAGHNFTHIVR